MAPVVLMLRCYAFFLCCLEASRSSRAICFFNSAACALRVSACSISLAAVDSSSSDSRRSCSEWDSSGTGTSCHTATAKATTRNVEVSGIARFRQRAKRHTKKIYASES